MDAISKKNFIMFLEKNPKLYAIAKSEMCIKLLELLSKQGLPIDEIKKTKDFSFMTEKDIETLLELLVQLKILNKEKIIGKIIYFANNNTKIFLEVYNETKKQYNVG